MPLKKAGSIIKNARWLPRLVQFFLGAVFVYASLHKIPDPGQFARIIYGYDLFPVYLINPMAVILPYFELFCGLALILNVYEKGGLLLINIMLLTFIIAISINLIRGHQFDCGCFSFSHNATGSNIELLVRDIVCLIAGMYLLMVRPRPRQDRMGASP